MKVTIKRIGKAYVQLCQCLLLAMTLLVITFVLLRYIFNLTFVWAEELISMLFISTTYLGAVIAMKHNEHISISYFYDSMPPSLKRVIDIINELVIFALQVAIVKISMVWIAKVGNNLSDGLRVPMRYFYYMMPLSAVLIGGLSILTIIDLVINKKAGLFEKTNNLTKEGA